MQDSNQTKSSDFLPGKPNMDGVMRGGVAMSPAAQSKPQNSADSAMTGTPQPTSAHVIDLKNASASVADSPLLNEVKEDTKEPTPAGPVSVKVASPIDTPKLVDPAPVESESNVEVPSSPVTPEPEKKVDDLNLAKPEAENSADTAPAPAKKSGKLKWILIGVGIVVVVAIAAVAVILITSTTK